MPEIPNKAVVIGRNQKVYSLFPIRRVEEGSMMAKTSIPASRMIKVIQADSGVWYSRDNDRAFRAGHVGSSAPPCCTAR